MSPGTTFSASALALQTGLHAPSLSVRYPAVPGSVPAARRAITEFTGATGADEELTDALRLAVSEAVTNVVRHAYPHSGGEVHVDVWRTTQDLWLIVADDGCGMRVSTNSDGLGQGLGLIQRMASDVWIVDRSTGGTEVRMRFRLEREL